VSGHIHPTALVDPGARLAADVTVGPGSIIGPGVEIGAGTEVGAHAILEGRVVIGARCRIAHGAVIGSAPQDLKYRPGTAAGVRIGDDTVIREYVTIHHATQEGADTWIGGHCLIMATAHIAHDAVIGDHVIIVNGAGITGHVVVEDRAIIGGLTGFSPFLRVGTFAYVGGLSRVNQDVAPFTIVAGSPARTHSVNVIGMRRGGIDATARRRMQDAFRILYRSGLAPAAAVVRLRSELGNDPLLSHLIQFVERSKRGIVPGAERRRGAAPEDEIDSESEESPS
jgi:UDP-N-acetylglucosamine acyltransferase